VQRGDEHVVHPEWLLHARVLRLEVAARLRRSMPDEPERRVRAVSELVEQGDVFVERLLRGRLPRIAVGGQENRVGERANAPGLASDLRPVAEDAIRENAGRVPARNLLRDLDEYG
jgi:hypothetical protein